MSPARRSLRRRDWPRGLYEKRPGYFTWRHPKTGKEYTIGHVPLPHAINEAIAANRHVLAAAPSLVAQLTGASNTVAELVADMPVAENRSTRNAFRAGDKVIVEGALVDGVRINGLGAIQANELTVKHCADLLDAMIQAGKVQQALAVRNRLIAVCARGIRKGWMATNPAEVTEKPKAVVARGRLTLEMYRAIHAAAEPWLQRAMDLALVTGQDRSTVAAMKRSDVIDGRLICQRSKTAAKAPPIAIPVSLYLQAIDRSLEALLSPPVRALRSDYILHHTEAKGVAKPGDPIRLATITAGFTEARKAASIPDTLPDGKGAPTFHEIRSLAKRLYDAQGGVDTKVLLGHMTEAMAKLYASTRDRTPIEVRVVNST